MPVTRPKQVYLAGSFFSTEHLWLVEEARLALRSLGIPCFSPLHEVGATNLDYVAAKDLAGLDKCSVVLALVSDMDPGTIFEIGYAVSKGIRVVALVENPGPQDLIMIRGTGCEVYDDFATAVYEVAWASME